MNAAMSQPRCAVGQTERPLELGRGRREADPVDIGDHGQAHAAASTTVATDVARSVSRPQLRLAAAIEPGP